MFEENGTSELSLLEFARRVGVSEATPSRHFNGKHVWIDLGVDRPHGVDVTPQCRRHGGEGSRCLDPIGQIPEIDDPILGDLILET